MTRQDILEKSITTYNTTRRQNAAYALCYAPFKYLYFSFDGKVYVCCDNKQQVVGKYPEESIREIWFGRKMNAFRTALSENDLSLNCNVCANKLIEQLWYSIPARMYDSRSMAPAGYPVFMDFELSNLCNLACVMCFDQFSSKLAGKAPGEFYGPDFVSQLREFIPHLQIAAFKGGEPLLVDIYYQIWEQIIALKPDCEISIVTNGQILTERFKQLLPHGKFCLRVSIDSLQKQIYEKIRVGGVFEKVQTNIDYFAEYARQHKYNFALMVSPLTLNWQELPEFVYYCNKLSAELYFTTVTYPEKLSLKYLPKSELQAIVAKYEQCNFPQITDQEKYNAGVFKNLLEQIKVWAKNAE